MVRNPIYVGVLLILLGESLLFMSLPMLYYALGMWPFFHFFVVFSEEPILQTKFGSSYEEYRNTVHRWLPRPPRRAQ